RYEVPLGLRLAELHRDYLARRGGADRGPVARNGADGGALRALRVAPGACVRRRASGPGRAAVLHELGGAGAGVGANRLTRQACNRLRCDQSGKFGWSLRLDLRSAQDRQSMPVWYLVSDWFWPAVRSV